MHVSIYFHMYVCLPVSLCALCACSQPAEARGGCHPGSGVNGGCVSLCGAGHRAWSSVQPLHVYDGGVSTFHVVTGL